VRARAVADADLAQRASSRLVSTVTPISSGRGVDVAQRVAARRHHRAPPLAWTLSIHTPSPAAALHACATVFGMS
jgi:hypothetical protein